MEEIYLAPRRAVEKMKASCQLRQTVFIYGATGYGKTTLVRHFLGERPYRSLSCACDLQEVEDLEALLQPGETVVLDDLQFLRNEEKQQAIVRMAEGSRLWLILVCRSMLPAWLMPLYIRSGFQMITESDLNIGEAEISAYLAEQDFTLPKEQLDFLTRESSGNPYVLLYVLRRVAEGRKVDAHMAEEARRAFSEHLEKNVILQWDSDLLEFLTQVSIVDAFTPALAEFITGSPFVTRLLDKALTTGSFLAKEGASYRLRSPLLYALRHRAETVYGSRYVQEFAYNAGLYYETHGRVVEALAMYERAGNTDRIRELLIRNARCNPGNGHYFELRAYYLRMEPEEIESSVVLMCGMSMLHSLLMQVEQSEHWYDRLKAYAESAAGGEKREALSRLAYLDIALPTRGSMKLLDYFTRLPALLLDKGMSLPEFSVTSNLPSVMNGGKDFCRWSPRDRELAATLGRVLERALGRYGKGLVNIGVAESQFEKGGDPYEVLALLSQAQLQVDAGGMPEIGFAATGVQVRVDLLLGNTDAALELLASAETRACAQQVPQLLPSIQAMRCRMALYQGEDEAVSAWLAQAPDENQAFCLLERYRYLTKVRCYLAGGHYTQAFSLLQKLDYYAKVCDRPYIRMEVGLLTAITRYRMGNDEWRPGLLDALRQASALGFIRLFSQEGGPALELLEKLHAERIPDSGVDHKWLARLIGQTRQFAARYPQYLRKQNTSQADFSENALLVLRLQADGLSAEEIAVKLGLKPATVRYHAKENYRKLGAGGKVEAVLTARRLGLL